MKSVIRIFLAVTLPITSFAGVNLKNGNYYISYTDIVVPGGGNDLEASRTYNSKSTEKGWFGFGWGSDFESFCVPGVDGSLTIHENGSGAMTRFTPKGEIDAKAAAQKIVDAMRKKSALNEEVAKTMIDKLTKDAELRQAYSRKYDVATKLATGTVLYSNERGMQEVAVVKEGYKRTFSDGRVEIYNPECKIAQVKDKNGYHVELNYEAGVLASIKDSQAKQLFFSWYPDGKIKSAWSAGDKKAEYKYLNDDLVESIDVAGNKYVYTYDSNHNMTSVGYSDGSKMKMSYSPKTQFCTEVVEKEGDITRYDYGSNPQNPDLHYWTTVSKLDSPEAKPSTSRYEYEIKIKPDGAQYTYRILTDINGIKTDTVYSECCSLPLKITRGKEVTTFEYNKTGLLTKKTSTKGEFVQLEYHPEYNKITKVVNNEGWTAFEYDTKANLSKATNHEGKSVLLIYDRNGRITKMVDFDKNTNQKRSLDFKYNNMGKPVEITMEKVGTINVAYDNYGEIKKVESQSGPKMALQVTQAFQSLLTIVKPAGVNLNM